MCKFAPMVLDEVKFAQIKYWAGEKFHAQKHSDGCEHSPHNHRRLANRFRKANTSISEQV